MKHIKDYLEQQIHIRLLYKGLRYVPEDRYSVSCFETYKLYNGHEINDILFKKIKAGEPFLAGRFGGHELAMMKTVEFGINRKFDLCMEKMCNNAGFFPNAKELAEPYFAEMINFCNACDILGVWFQPFEGYFIRQYMSKEVVLTNIFDLEPWKNPGNPWSAALAGKKVLVIHPFEKSIHEQYKKRELIFPGTDILPYFDLKTIKAVQTAGGESDGRFQSWFDALDYMTDQARQIDFDIAIIGCGAYGAPLAARIKKMGKQAIHLGGATQLMFGIYGNRWIENGRGVFDYVKKLMNDNWVRPSEEERIKNKGKIENGCYW